MILRAGFYCITFLASSKPHWPLSQMVRIAIFHASASPLVWPWWKTPVRLLYGWWAQICANVTVRSGSISGPRMARFDFRSVWAVIWWCERFMTCGKARSYRSWRLDVINLDHPSRNGVLYRIRWRSLRLLVELIVNQVLIAILAGVVGTMRKWANFLNNLLMNKGITITKPNLINISWNDHQSSFRLKKYQ